MKKITSLIIILTLLFSLLSCSKEESAAITCGETTVSSDIFYSQLISYKSDFLYSYLGLTDDNPTIWTQDAPSGRLETLGDALIRMVKEDMTQFAWVVEWARVNEGGLTEEDEKEIEDSKKALRDYFESEEDYKAYLDSLKMTEEVLDDYVRLTKLYDKGFKALTSEGGAYQLAEGVEESYFKDNFVTVKHIFINNVDKLAEDGESAIALTEEEIKEKNAYADTLVSRLEKGEDFDSLYSLSEDGVAENYPDGLTFAKNMMNDSNYEKLAFEMKEGEWQRIDGQNGGVYIIKKVALADSAFAEYETYITSLLNEEISMQIYADHKGEVTVNEKLMSSYNMAEIPV